MNDHLAIEVAAVGDHQLAAVDGGHQLAAVTIEVARVAISSRRWRLRSRWAAPTGSSVSTEQVVDHTYERCDQENLIAQMGSGLAAWRMPVAEFAGNCAWLEIARLAWNLAKWIARLALPDQVLCWHGG